MKRMKLFLVGLVMALLPLAALVAPVPLLAGTAWQLPIPTPSRYGNRVYGYEQMTRFWINENGYELDTDDANMVSRMWSSVFYVPNGPQDSGYTAVTNLDAKTNTIDNNNTAYQTVLQDFLEAFNIPYDSSTNSWLVSPQYNTATYGQGSPFSQQSGLDFDVPLHFWVSPPSGTETLSGVTLTPPPGPNYSISGSGPQNPYPLYVGSAADVGAGYQPDGSVAYWEAYGGPDEWGNMSNGIANMTQDEAVIQYDTYSAGYGQSGVQQDRSTTGNVIVSYPFTSELEAIDLSGDTVTCTALNPTPYDVLGENWYVYVVTSDEYGEYTGAPTLLTQGTVNIGAHPLGNTAPNQSQFTFAVPSSDAGDELIVTLNETLNSDGGVNPEGLPVYYAWGPNSNTEVPADNSPKDQIVPLNVWNVTSQGTDYDPAGTPVAYAGNAQDLILPGGSSGTLAVTPPTAIVSVGGNQQYEAIYTASNGTQTDVTSQSGCTWSTTNPAIATISTGGLATGVSATVTGGTQDSSAIVAQYNPSSGTTLTARAGITVMQGAVMSSSYNIHVNPLDSGTGSGVAAGNSYTASTTFLSSFPTSGDVQVDWYQQNNPSSGTGDWTLIGQSTYSIEANSTNTVSQQWTYPSSGAASVNILVTVDDPLTGLPATTETFQNLPFPVDTGSGQMETSYSDNFAEANISVPGSSETNIFGSGEVQIPVTTTQTITENVPYTYYTYSWKKIPIVPGPPYTMGPPHYYLSY